MRSPLDMDTVQIELTNACHSSCSNCTRFCGHREPFFMTEEDFDIALLTMSNFPRMVGLMGGEPLLHPLFSEFCYKVRHTIPREQAGLWTSLPKSHVHLREDIASTFGNIFINDHTQGTVLHKPLLVASNECYESIEMLFYHADHCWIQNAWSASITPKGAYFCEVAAALAMLFDGSDGWEVEPLWWTRVPKDFTSQVDEFCPLCGGCVPLLARTSSDGRDDVSPGNLERLKAVGSKKVDRGQFVVHDCEIPLVPPDECMATYKDINYRQRVAKKYGLYLVLKDDGFCDPILLRKWSDK